MADLDKWIEIAKECKYLPENDLKCLCDLVCDLLLEESNVQPVSTPVTVCGDIHGQVTLTIMYILIFCLLFFKFFTHYQSFLRLGNSELYI